MTECSCCSEKYTCSIRTKISCGYCVYEACKPCVSRYLLSQAVGAHCMSCRTGWNREFLDKNLTQTFRKGPWRNHLKQMLLIREKAVLPNFQKYAAARKMLNELAPKMEAAQIEYRAARSASNSLHYDIQSYPHKASLTPDTDENNAEIAATYKSMLIEYNKYSIITCSKEIIQDRITDQYNTHHNIYYNNAGPKEKKEFIMKCVVDGCRGFLSSSYKCELCSTYVCKECMVVKKEKHDTSHVCDKEHIESVALIRKETRPCPKCGIRISKIDGCDQMWCVSEGCNTAFSWNSGKVISGTVHNPHYYEWLRRTTGSVPRAPGDNPCDIPNAGRFYRMMVGLPPDIIGSCGNIKRCLDDLTDVRIPQYLPVDDPYKYKEFHVDYLLGNCTEDAWIQSIFLRESATERKQQIGLILQTFHNAGSDLMRGLLQQLTDLTTPKRVLSEKDLLPLRSIIVEFEELRVYINESLVSMGKAVPCAVPQYNEVYEYIPAARLDKVKENTS